MVQTLKILSYNIHKGFNASNTRFVLPHLRQNILNIGADVLFLQEVQGKLKRSREKKIYIPEEPQTEYLAAEHWPYYLYGKNAKYGSAHHGNALLSIYPFADWENINVAFSKRMSRSLLHGRIDLAHRHLHVVCIHLGLFPIEMMNQLRILAKVIHTKIPEDEPLIIAGDFNDWRRKAFIHLEDELGLQEVFKSSKGDFARTYPTWRPSFQVDRIYYRKLTLVSAQMLNESPWHKLSDHFPLTAEFSFLT